MRKYSIVEKPFDMNFNELKEIVEKAIAQLYSQEAYLIKYGLSEWTLSAQFHYYMRTACCEKLKEYDFDSEYNLMSKIWDKGYAQKCICVNGESLRVRPDFIIHKRGDSSGNFLWVEMKRKGGAKWTKDLDRVRAVTKGCIYERGVDYVTGYAYGLGVFFRKRKVICQWYANGNGVNRRVMAKNSSGAWEWFDGMFAVGVI